MPGLARNRVSCNKATSQLPFTADSLLPSYRRPRPSKVPSRGMHRGTPNTYTEKVGRNEWIYIEDVYLCVLMPRTTHIT